MELVGIAHQEEQKDDCDVDRESDDDERKHRDGAVPSKEGEVLDLEGLDGPDIVPFEDEGEDVKEDEGGLVKDEPHDHDGGGVRDLDALLLHRVDLHDLTAASAWCDVVIEGADHGVGQALVEIVLPGIETAEDKDDESLDAVGKEHKASDDRKPKRITIRESVSDDAETFLDVAFTCVIKRKNQGEDGQESDEEKAENSRLFTRFRFFFLGSFEYELLFFRHR